jgi:hypothetical protein
MDSEGFVQRRSRERRRRDTFFGDGAHIKKDCAAVGGICTFFPSIRGLGGCVIFFCFPQVRCVVFALVKITFAKKTYHLPSLLPLSTPRLLFTVILVSSFRHDSTHTLLPAPFLARAMMPLAKSCGS